MYSLRHSYSRKSHLAREKDPQKNFFYFNTRTVQDHGCSSRHVLHETIQSLDNPIGESREISEHVVRPSAGFHGTTSREEPLLRGTSQHLCALPEERIPEEQPARSAHVDHEEVFVFRPGARLARHWLDTITLSWPRFSLSLSLSLSPHLLCAAGSSSSSSASTPTCSRMFLLLASGPNPRVYRAAHVGVGSIERHRTDGRIDTDMHR